MTLALKAAESELDFPISYDLAVGETIASSAWTVLPVETGGLAVKSGTPAIVGAVASCIVTGGVLRRVYRLRKTVVTSQGRTYAQTIGIRIGEVEPT